jgi:hypothetical protein
MAIKLEFISVIVPMNKIREKLGEDACESQFAMVTDITWQDGHLFRDGCMNPLDLEDMLDEWEGRGFELLTVIDGQKHWKDVCVVYSGRGPSYPCAWIEYDPNENIVWLKGQDPGDAVGPAGRKVAGED